MYGMFWYVCNGVLSAMVQEVLSIRYRRCVNPSIHTYIHTSSGKKLGEWVYIGDLVTDVEVDESDDG